MQGIKKAISMAYEYDLIWPLFGFTNSKSNIRANVKIIKILNISGNKL